MEGNLQQVSEEISGRYGDIMRKFMHRNKVITSMSNDVV